MCLLAAFAVVWLGRPLTTYLKLPRALDSLDVPLVVLAGGLGLITGTRGGRWSLWWWACAGFIATGAAGAWVFDGLSHPAVLLGPFLLLEGFLFIGAACSLTPTKAQRKVMLWVFLFTLGAQIPLALWQFSRHGAAPGSGDDVQGTLVGAGAGAHMLSAALCIGAATWLTTRSPVLSKALVVALVGVVVVVADAKQVLAALPVAVLAVFLQRLVQPRVSAKVKVAAGALSIAVVVAVFVALDTGYFGNYVNYTLKTGGGKIASTTALLADMQDSGARGIVGFGPGQTVTRFATLPTPISKVGGSAVDLFGVPASGRAEHYQAVTTAEGFVGTSSFTLAMSSLIGVLGDYGLVGMACFLWLLVLLASALKNTTSRFVLPATVGWSIALVLGLITDGLEEPPLVITAAVVTALALLDTDRPRLGRGAE